MELANLSAVNDAQDDVVRNEYTRSEVLDDRGFEFQGHSEIAPVEQRILQLAMFGSHCVGFDMGLCCLLRGFGTDESFELFERCRVAEIAANVVDLWFTARAALRGGRVASEVVVGG